MGREDEIEAIAFSIWQEEGCCDGRDVDHWLRAEAIWEERRQAQQPNNEIEAIAYNIWQEEGCCDGRDVDHWLRAEEVWEEQRQAQAPVVPEKKARQTTGAKTRKTTAQK